MPLIEKEKEVKLKQISIDPAFPKKDFEEIKLYLEFAGIDERDFFSKAGELFSVKNNIEKKLTFETKVSFKFDEKLAESIEKNNISFEEHFTKAAYYVLSKDKEFKTWKKNRSIQ